jgi:hypothetical protein
LAIEPEQLPRRAGGAPLPPRPWPDGGIRGIRCGRAASR